MHALGGYLTFHHWKISPERTMATRTYRLIYPPSHLKRPIINQVILEFELSINIMRAHITQNEGWLEIQMTGDPDEIKRAIQWLTKEGITIKSIN
jgi:ABC-type methionine transport system ATPase subunit